MFGETPCEETRLARLRGNVVKIRVVASFSRWQKKIINVNGFQEINHF